MTAAPALQRTRPCTVALRELPAALRSLWSSACEDRLAGDIMRALTINFVGLAPAAAAPALRAAADRLLRRIPCRAFLLLVDDAVTDVAATVTAATRDHGGTHDIVLEEIEIRMPARWFGHVPGLVRPLLVNDLPSHLYWAAGWPQDAQRFDCLSRLCDHTIVDTRLFGLPAVEVEQLAARRAAGRRITDLSWLRLRPWRRALAEAFERIPWTAGANLQTTIRHGRRGIAAAMLLGEWLEQRLGGAIVLEEGDADLDGCPQAISLRGATFTVELQVQQDQILVHASTDTHCHLPFAVRASRGADGDLLAAAIDIA